MKYLHFRYTYMNYLRWVLLLYHLSLSSIYFYNFDLLTIFSAKCFSYVSPKQLQLFFQNWWKRSESFTTLVSLISPVLHKIQSRAWFTWFQHLDVSENKFEKTHVRILDLPDPSGNRNHGTHQLLVVTC